MFECLSNQQAVERMAVRPKQSRPDASRGGHFAGARGALPGDDRRALRSARDARRPACGPRAERRTLERIYLGRRFKNDTERLETLFELYTQMTARQAPAAKPAKRKTKGPDA
jgi:hypothetical protein